MLIENSAVDVEQRSEEYYKSSHAHFGHEKSFAVVWLDR